MYGTQTPVVEAQATCGARLRLTRSARTVGVGAPIRSYRIGSLCDYTTSTGVYSYYMYMYVEFYAMHLPQR